MVALYTSLLVLLATAGFLIRRRASTLEKKYTRVLKEANSLLHSPHKDSGSRTDPYQSARRTCQLGALAEKKERLEASHYRWQARAERVERLTGKMRSWRGRKFPYVVGAIDALTALCLLEYAGLGEYTNPRQLVQLVTTWITG
jgi:hypothetical protein